MITAILFDLDGTLLPMDQDKFVSNYLPCMTKKMSEYGYDPNALMQTIYAGIKAMVKNDGSVTNKEAFWNTAAEILGPDVRKDEPLFEDFYRNEFQQAKTTCGYTSLATEAVRDAKAKGCRVILATNPLFASVATYSRIRWAGLEPEDFEYITTYENSSHSKPNLDYYRELMGKLDLKAEQCLMVGNDMDEDMIAENLGMRAFLLTDCLINRKNQDISKYPHGSFPELLSYIRSL